MTTDLHRVLVPVERSAEATAALDVAVRLAPCPVPVVVPV